jgi:ATP-binding cassette, subfamily C (CFTR/MRP), member 1
MKTALRGGFATLIFAKSLTTKAGQEDLAPVTLLSSDINAITQSLTYGVDSWAKIAEVLIGVWLLWRQLGAVAVAPVLISFFCFFIQGWASKYLGIFQGKWVDAMQRRVGITSTVVRSMKSVKLAGLVGSMITLLETEKSNEIRCAKRYRWANVGLNVIGEYWPRFY